VDWSYQEMADSCKNGNDISGPIKSGDFLDQLND
jgi:hypothetical protein